MDEERELMTATFEEFRQLVGAGQHAVRAALASLGLKPEPQFNDARKTRYPREWVERVRAEVERMRQ